MNHIKELVEPSQSCAPKTKLRFITNGHKNDEIESIQKPRGHEEDRASFPNQIPYKVSTIHGQNQLKREEQREGDAGAAAWGNREFTDKF